MTAVLTSMKTSKSYGLTAPDGEATFSVVLPSRCTYPAAHYLVLETYHRYQGPASFNHEQRLFHRPARVLLACLSKSCLHQRFAHLIVTSKWQQNRATGPIPLVLRSTT